MRSPQGVDDWKGNFIDFPIIIVLVFTYFIGYFVLAPRQPFGIYDDIMSLAQIENCKSNVMKVWLDTPVLDNAWDICIICLPLELLILEKRMAFRNYSKYGGQFAPSRTFERLCASPLSVETRVSFVLYVASVTGIASVWKKTSADGAKQNLKGKPLNSVIFFVQNCSSLITGSGSIMESDQCARDSIARYEARVLSLHTGPSARDIEMICPANEAKFFLGTGRADCVKETIASMLSSNLLILDCGTKKLLCYWI